MIKVGLTGGIGSGKSLISMIFSKLGIPVYDSDTRAKQLYQTDSILKEKLIETFGYQVYLDNGQINRSFLGGLIFSNKDLLDKINKIVHPRVKFDFERWVSENNKADYVIKEAAILIESGAYKQLDKIIVVKCPLEIRLNRVMERDKISREDVLKRSNNQMTEDKLIEYSDYLVVNDGKLALLPQVLAIHHQILNLQHEKIV